MYYDSVCIITGQHSTNDLNDGYLGSGIRILRSIKKYGKSNHVKEIITFLKNVDELNKAEEYFLCDTILNDDMCLNIARGGKHPKHTDVTKKKIKLFQNSSKHPQVNKFLNYEERKRMAIFANKKHSSETIEKIKMNNKKDMSNRLERKPYKDEKDYKISKELRDKLRDSNLGKPKSEEHKKKLSEANKGVKPINAIHVIIDDVLYIGMEDAAKAQNINYSTLRNRLNSKNIAFVNWYRDDKKKELLTDENGNTFVNFKI